jgi:tetratricopeptide (TPR) repeat protein
VGKSTLVGALLQQGVSGVSQVLSVPLSAATDLDDVAVRLGQALGVTQPDLDTLSRALTARGAALVVLDDTEHLPVDELLAQLGETPTAWVCTTRVPLRRPGVTHLVLAPLSTADGVQLLRDRLGELGAPEPPAEASRALVEALDGLPLAIELAASRGRVLSVPQMLDRLDQRFRLLSTRVEHPRWSSLQHALDWSWELLDAPQRAALHQLATFRGGFTLEAAEAVVDQTEGRWVVDLLQELVELGMVHRTGAAALPRYALYRSVEEFVSRRQTPPELDARARHLGWFAGVVEHPFCIQELDDRANHEAALAHAVGVGDADQAIAVARVLWRGYHRSGPLERGAEALDRARTLQGASAWPALDLLLDIGWAQWGSGTTEAAAATFAEARSQAEARSLPEDGALLGLGITAHRAGAVADAEAHLQRGLQVAADAETRARLHLALASLLAEQPRLEEAERHAEAAVAIARKVGSRQLLGRALHHLGGARADLQRDAVPLFEEAREILLADGDRVGAARALGAMAGVHFSNRAELAEQQMREVLAVSRELGDRRSECATLLNLGMLLTSSRPAEARELLQSALDLEVGDAHREGKLHIALGNVALLEGNLDDADAHFRAGLEVHRELGDERVEARTIGRLGTIARLRGEHAEAEARFRAALATHRRVGYRLGESSALSHLGVLLTELGRTVEARPLLEQALDLAIQIGLRNVQATCSAELAELELQDGQLEVARRHLDDAEAGLREVDDRFELCGVLGTRVRLEVALGDLTAAQAALDEACALRDDLGVTTGVLVDRIEAATACLER